MQNENTKSQVLSSLFWKLMERGGTQGIQFIVQLFLARLLLPEDYGVIALITIFIGLANVFVQSGFNTALIQKKDADEVDYSSVLYLTLFVAGVFYIILFFSAPFIANFYREPQLKMVLRVLALTLFFGAFNSIQNAYIAKNMLFKKLFFSSLGAIIVSGTVGVVAAYMGYGVWALVAQQLTNRVMISIIMWFTIKWRPKLVFSFKRVKSLFSYGWKLLASGLLNTLYMDLRTLIIGRLYSPAILGYYNRGKQFPQFIVSNIDGSIQSVMLPTLSAHQDDRKRVKEMVRRSILTSSYIMFPAMVGLAVVAEPLIKIILTDKWLPAVPYLQIFCVAYVLMPIHTANLQAINALGRSDIFLKLEIIKKFIGIGILFISLPFGVMGLAIGEVVSGIIGSFVNAYPNKQLLNYSYKEQWKDIMPSLLLSLAMGIVVYGIGLMKLSVVKTLGLQVGLGGAIYIILSKIFKIDSFEYLTGTIRQVFNQKV